MATNPTPSRGKLAHDETAGQKIRALVPGKFVTLDRVKPCGSLEARQLTNGTVVLYWRITLGGKTDRVKIGTYDGSISPKTLAPVGSAYSVAAALRAAEDKAKAHDASKEQGGYLGMVQREKADAKAVNEAAAASKAEAAQEIAHAAQFTLEALMASYIGYLAKLERQAVSDVTSIVKHHIVDAWPQIAKMPANLVTFEQIADMQRRLIEAGKGRTGNKLRSYIRAAYQLALASRSKASVPLAFKAYKVTHNPAADTVPDDTQNKADKNPLSTEEMRLYWQALKPLTGFRGAVLRLHLLTGGQRIAQLMRLETASIEAHHINLLDSKGKPGKAPRPQSVPLTAAAAAALAECKPVGVYALSTDGGKTHLAPTTFSNWSKEAGKSIPEFNAKRIRSGVETLLASARISTEIRGRLQSHGISGVQARHYDGYSYMDEKTHAVETLFNLLESAEINNVVLFKAA